MLFKVRRFVRFFVFTCLLTLLTGGNTAAGETSGPYIAIETGGYQIGGIHTCGLRENGTVTCWGNDIAGQSYHQPVATFKQISAGGFHNCGLRSDNTLLCWGDDTFGQSSSPTGTFKQVSAGGSYTCGVRTDGTLACWGYNGNGQATPPAGTFSQVSTRYGFTCAVSSVSRQPYGQVKCWGNDEWGKASPPDGDFTQVSVGESHACGIRTDGSVDCWGKGTNGQTFPPTGSFKQLVSGENHSCGLRTDGSVACWGLNDYGQTNAPVDTFSQISADGIQTCGLKADGTGTCWGGEGPLPPIDLTVRYLSENQVILSWVDASSDETDFQIMRIRLDGPGSWVEVGRATGSSYIDSSLVTGESYNYLVASYRESDGKSTASRVASALGEQYFLPGIYKAQ